MDTVFFIASKLAGAALKLETWLALIALLAFWAALREYLGRARRRMGLLVALLLIIGLLPLVDLWLRPMETPFPILEGPGAIDGIIVLGGGEDVQASINSGQPQIGTGGDRYLAGLALATRAPRARILFAGGGGGLRDTSGVEVSGAAIAERTFGLRASRRTGFSSRAAHAIRWRMRALPSRSRSHARSSAGYW